MKLFIVITVVILCTSCLSIGDRCWIYELQNSDWQEVDDKQYQKSFNNYSVSIESIFCALGIEHEIRIEPQTILELYPSRIWFHSLESPGIVHRPFKITVLQGKNELLDITIEPINGLFKVISYSELYVKKIILIENNKKRIISPYDLNNLKIEINSPTVIHYRVDGFDFSDRAGYPNPQKNCFRTVTRIIEDTEENQIFTTNVSYN